MSNPLSEYLKYYSPSKKNPRIISVDLLFHIKHLSEYSSNIHLIK